MIVTPMLVALGLTTLYWRKELADGLCAHHTRVASAIFGDTIDWDTPVFRTFYRGLLLFFGAVLFVAKRYAAITPPVHATTSINRMSSQTSWPKKDNQNDRPYDPPPNPRDVWMGSLPFQDLLVNSHR
jgi:hypothetical protein